METYENLNSLSEGFGTPFFLFDQERFEANFREFDAAFRSRYPRLIVGYSYKTNYLPHLCRLVRDLGGEAEVVSELEYDLALRLGQNPAATIVNGPIKPYSLIERALDLGSRLNLDSWYELEHLERYAAARPGRPIRVGLRVNLQLLDASGRSQIQAGLPVSRFGFPPEEIGAALRRLHRLGGTLSGLHAHASSSSRALWIYGHVARSLCELAAEHAPQGLEYLDIGGGMFGRVPAQMRTTPPPTFDDYAATVAAIFNGHPWVERHRPTLIVEPGIALAADTFRLVTRVIDLKTIGANRFALVDGSVLQAKPGMHGVNQPCRIVSPRPAAGEERYQVVGATCMEKDYLLKDALLPTLAPGDFLVIDQVGAYTMVMTPPFIHTAPPILAVIGGICRPLRSRQSFDAFFSGFAFPEDRPLSTGADRSRGSREVIPAATPPVSGGLP